MWVWLSCGLVVPWKCPPNCARPAYSPLASSPIPQGQRILAEQLSSSQTSSKGDSSKDNLASAILGGEGTARDRMRTRRMMPQNTADVLRWGKTYFQAASEHSDRWARVGEGWVGVPVVAYCLVCVRVHLCVCMWWRHGGLVVRTSVLQH